MSDGEAHNEESSFAEVQADFDLDVNQLEGQTVVTARLGQPAQRCYELFSDADLIPQWLWVVGKAVIQERDARGRALRVDFIGSLERASIAYTLVYDYDDARREVRWHHEGGGVKTLAGSARFDPPGGGRQEHEGCTLRYTLCSELSAGLPSWADDLYKKRPAETVVIDFCEWLEHHVAG